MGTHPIFESDFDCLTERRRIEKMNTVSSVGGIINKAIESKAKKNEHITFTTASRQHLALACRNFLEQLSASMMDQLISDESAKSIVYVHLARVFQIDPRLAEFKKFFPLSMTFETALALRKQEQDNHNEDDEVFVFQAPPRVEVSRAAHHHVKQEQEDKLLASPSPSLPPPVVREISSEIEKMAIISPRPNRKSDATKKQTKISNYFRKSSN